MHYLEFSGHCHHIVIRGVVLVAVGEHQSNISGELLGVEILSPIHLPLKRREVKTFQPHAIFTKSQIKLSELSEVPQVLVEVP